MTGLCSSQVVALLGAGGVCGCVSGWVLCMDGI